ncbi:MAG TPA: HAD family hydrolase [Chloroflexota bacterium]|nr:HAD family hydrolase [Chloroflexota bacterium]
MATLRAVTFDLGGTLVEYENIPWESLEATGWRGVYQRLALEGRYTHLARTVAGGTADDFTETMMAISTRFWRRAEETQQSAALHHVFAEALGGLEVPPADFMDLAEHFHAATVELVSVYEDSLPTLLELKRRGLKLALISNTLWPGELHTRDPRRFGLHEFFDVLTYSSEMPHTKPHPAIFLETLRRLGDVPPAAAAHVGDRIVDDVRGAQGAGMKGILKAHPRRVAVEGIHPDARITHLAELPAALDACFGGAT